MTFLWLPAHMTGVWRSLSVIMFMSIGGFVVGFYKGSGAHDLSPSPFTVLNELKWSNKKLHNFLLDLVL